MDEESNGDRRVEINVSHYRSGYEESYGGGRVETRLVIMHIDEERYGGGRLELRWVITDMDEESNGDGRVETM